MKKSLMIISLLLCSVFMITGCGNSSGENDDSKLSVYEFHQYDSDFDHTEEMVIKYNEEGKLVYAEAYWTLDDAGENASCDFVKNRFKTSDDAKYKDVKMECKLSGKQMTVKYIITDESLKDGYLQNDDEYYQSYFDGGYDIFKEEEIFKKYLENQIEYFREKNLFEDERNYIVMDGERIDS